MDLGMLRNAEIEKVGDMILDSDEKLHTVKAEIYNIAMDYGFTYKNIAGRLIRYLERKPLDMRESRPWVGTLIQDLRDNGVFVHRSTKYPAWAPQATLA